ncbi:MAG: hypothetical protein LBG93_09910 [Treponema sp.]|jgi:hypothetical protein|nr:hypothetical protein [Treponema sp.]
MYYSNELIDSLEKKVSLDKDMYANIQAHNVVKMLSANKSWYKLFGVYWWAVKEALRKYVDNSKWYCGIQDDPLMKERAWHGSEFRTMLAAMYHSNEKREITSACVWYDKDGESHQYTLYDADAEE